MAASDHDRVGWGLEWLAVGLAPYVDARMTATSAAGQDWLRAMASRDSARFGGPKRQYSLSDPRLLLRVVTEEWGTFSGQLPPAVRAFASELRSTGNKWAHRDSFSADETRRALDTMERLLSAVGALDQASEVRRI
jgi:hypothetical protein